MVVRFLSKPLNSNQRGYEKTAFEDTFVRYLYSTPIQIGTVEQTSNHSACSQFKNGATGVSVPLSKLAHSSMLTAITVCRKLSRMI